MCWSRKKGIVDQMDRRSWGPRFMDILEEGENRAETRGLRRRKREEGGLKGNQGSVLGIADAIVQFHVALASGGKNIFEKTSGISPSSLRLISIISLSFNCIGPTILSL
ncbi:hypothetical protein TWF730_001674 [Orbilia blumenaviensis]|uniref:Uncharacterized protein n=1 Tax=Orbilia blumenaviensis TaxID=1796055 RepID=A0AAV9UJ75_9PEZI